MNDAPPLTAVMADTVADGVPAPLKVGAGIVKSAARAITESPLLSFGSMVQRMDSLTFSWEREFTVPTQMRIDVAGSGVPATKSWIGP